MTASVLNYRSHKSVKKQMKHYLKHTNTVFLYKSNFTTNGNFFYLDIFDNVSDFDSVTKNNIYSLFFTEIWQKWSENNKGA